MKRKLYILRNSLVVMVAAAIILISSTGCNNVKFAQPVQKAEGQLPVSTVTHSVETDIINIATNKFSFINTWENIKDSVINTSGVITEKAESFVNYFSNTSSVIHRNLDYPLTSVVRALLGNQHVTDFTGIRCYSYISGDAGKADVYIVEEDGCIAGIMDGIINIFGYAEAGGGTLYPYGIFIKESELSVGQFYRVELHEYCHYYQQSVLGTDLWLKLYSGEILLKCLLNGDILQSYENCSWEVAADIWADVMVCC